MIALVVLIALIFLIVTAPVDADDDHYDIRRSIESGEVVRLERLLTHIQKDFGGRILEVELERENHAGDLSWVYEAKVLTPDGRVLKLEYDASTMQLLKLTGRHKQSREEDDD